MDLQLTRLPNEPVQVAGFGKQDMCVLDFYMVVIVEFLFSHHTFAWFSKPDLLVDFLHPDLNNVEEH